MFEMPLIIPLPLCTLYLGIVLILLSGLIQPKHERAWFAFGFVLGCIGLLMWFCVPGLEVVVW
jgi:hypothetical protein